MSPTFYRLLYSAEKKVQDRRFQKALESHSEKILFFCDWLSNPKALEETRLEFLRQGRKVCIQIAHQEILGAKSELINNLVQNFSQVIIVFTPSERIVSGHLDALYTHREQLLFLLDFNEGFDVSAFFSVLPVWIRQAMHFHPCTLSLKTKQIHELGKKIISLFPEIKFLPIPGLDQFDLRISEQVELVPQGELKLRLQSLSPAIKMAVIIPTYDNQEYLLNCIRHLLDQDLERDQFEIIVVDDGTPALNIEALDSFLVPEAGQLNFAYYYIPKKQILGGFFGNFRAGLCRNFGVRQSQGEFINFLDSDMIAPPQYLNNAMKTLATADLVQSVRHHIHPAKSNRFTSYHLLTKKDLFVEEKGYWSPFFDSHDWMSIPDFWKYTCTYSLSMKRSFFTRMGQFRKSYVSYGFEDTDFGYQAFREGAKFHLDKTPIYHLTPYADKSRYKHSMFYKHQLLRLTAKTFYANNLSPEVFKKMKSLMD